MKAARVNESRSRLNAALRGCFFAEFWQPVDFDVTADDPMSWPKPVREGLMLAYTEWRQQIGRIHILGRTHACVPTEDKRHACVLQINYARVRDETVSAQPTRLGPRSESASGDAESSGKAARSFSPSMCGEG